MLLQCPQEVRCLWKLWIVKEGKDNPFIANILIQAIEQVGAQNVVQVVIDNTKNCRAANFLVEERFKHIFWTTCLVHSLNLMLQKIGTKIE